MRKFLVIVLSVLLLLSLTSNITAKQRGIRVTAKTPAGKTIPLYGHSYALIIGNGNYAKGWDPLPGAIHDVKDVARALKDNGFDKVILKTDLTRNGFNQAFGNFFYKYGRDKNNRLLFYYAGHGYTQKMANDEDLGYLVMVDAPVPEKDPVGFEISSVDMQAIVTRAKKTNARHVLFMFDSCFSGSILNLRERVTPENISENVRLPVRQFITAGRSNEPVPDHSIFKQAFLDLLEGRDKEPIPDGYITGEELGLYLKNKVPQYNPTQHPQYGKIKDIHLDKGDFVFQLTSSSGTPSSPNEPSGLASEERNRLEEEKALIEKERQELARLKAEFERKQRESQKEKVEMASVPSKPSYPRPSPSNSNITGFDGVYVAYANGIVRDTSTGLEWIAGPDRDLHWDDAKSWVNELNSDGDAWRMPTIDELRTLYKEGDGTCNMPSFFKNTGCYVWSGEGFQSDAATFFDFKFGVATWDTSRQVVRRCRAFAVRSRSDSRFAKRPGQSDVSHQAKEIGRDGRFIAYNNGTVLDTRTNLMWAAKDDGRGLLIDDAKHYINTYKVGGYKNWRMPTSDELGTIYNPDRKNMRGYYVTQLIDITDEWVWASIGWGSFRPYNFTFGDFSVGAYGESWGTRTHDARALPVRDITDTE